MPAAASVGAPLRRGLPRVAGGEPWPAAAAVPAPAPAATAAPAAAPAATTPAAPAVAAPAAEASAPAATETATATALAERPAHRAPRPPLTLPRTVWPGAAPREPLPARPEPRQIRGLTRGQWALRILVGGAALLITAFLAVTFVRGLLSIPAMQDFLVTYPGETHLPESAPVGFPAWLGWAHFFNMFLIVLIIRSGLEVRTQKRPPMFWSPRWNSKRKISISLWFHQSLDVLWLLNGLIFVVLLFATGQWMRVVPTSWEIFPNALSAALQYISLDWPTENGWVNYNSLQVLAYFTTIFIAAPLAALTGWRMSGLWPKKVEWMNRAFPVEWARAVHFPVMLYFVVFIIFHVALVFATGALRNLNHMYAAQGSADPAAYADNWAGFWIFVGSMVLVIAAWIAARPVILGQIARLSGTVTER